MTTQGRNLAGWWVVALIMLAFSAKPAAGITLTLRDIVDPVPPGGVLVYTILVNDSEGGNGNGPVVCFNPPPECTTFPADCSIGSPSCVGNSFTGYVCQNAQNEGVNCGVGDPPIPNLTLCVRKTTGTCTGGPNAGYPCSSAAQCPGQTFVCTHAFNDGDFCGTGSPLMPNQNLCLANPTGVCSGGPGIGLPCTAPHNAITEECPQEGAGSETDGITIKLPIPLGTSFLDADSGGTSDGEEITWVMTHLNPCGEAGLPQCPLLTARLTVDSLTPIGTVIQNTATVTGPLGPAQSGSPQTTVGEFNLRRLIIAKAKKEERDRFIYRVLFTLAAGKEIDPPNEAGSIKAETGSGQLVLDLGWERGELLPFSRSAFKLVRREPGLRRVLLRQIAESHYRLNLSAIRFTVDAPEEQELVVTLTLGDDVIVQPIFLFIRGAGRRFIGE